MSQSIRRKYWVPAIADTHKPGAFERLDAGYSEKKTRAYHAWGHIGDLLKKLEGFSELASRPDLIAIAIFWHDVIYKTQNPDGSLRPDRENVLESAELFRRYTLLPEMEADAVYSMIMATGNHMTARPEREFYPGFGNDYDLFLDLDLSALGAPWVKFSRDTGKIRFEYGWVPENAFCRGRAAILKKFVQEGVKLFRRAETASKWGASAKANLMRSISELEARAAAPS